ncbi:hypothetical protein [Devosia sp. RR2S18]|jgi:hypothetical protein|uniref:hypothetical protein n=1 Tax=Devosia rhizosphaerae TaxID=3049774 RepID=UPI0025425367|nr:hypothetical protein [Devosia sp. RR2S18]WIJ24727.1 hypothetical protein QOV41_17205 [Devosia sp. RR2S18]HEV7292073.1 hypothetical protein [Devosia sp.]
MEPNKTALERAFELAHSGRFTTSSEIKSAVSEEGYSVAQITGRTLMKQLRDIIRAKETAD